MTSVRTLFNQDRALLARQQAIPGFHLNPRLANLPPEQLQALQAMMRQQLAAYKQNGQADGVDGGAVQAGAPLTGLSLPLDLTPQAPAPPMTLVGAVKLGLIPVVRRMLEQSVEHKQTVLAQLGAYQVETAEGRVDPV